MRFFKFLARHFFCVLCAVIFSFVIFGCTTIAKREINVYDRTLTKQQLAINPKIKKHSYNLKYLKNDGDFYYTKKGANFSVINGVDISRHQGDVDFDLLRKNGYEFVFLRLAFRRYGLETGNLEKDERFDEYFSAAKNAGFKIGVYVFSQAVNDEEALEEAQIVLENLTPQDLQLPVVYDPELVLWEEARTDFVSEEQFNRNTEIFCSTIQNAGFDVMIYANIMWQTLIFTPETLNKYPVWFAQYTKKPTTPYNFVFWQYSGNSPIEGTEHPCDMNVWFLPTRKK